MGGMHPGRGLLPLGGGRDKSANSVRVPVAWVSARQPRLAATPRTPMTKFTHITDSERLQIEHGLRQGASIRMIAATIARHH